MKKRTKLVSGICAITMIVAALTGCTGNKEASTSKSSDNSFTYWVTMDNNTSRSQKNFGDLLIYQEMEKRTGIHIDFIHPIAGSTGSEAFLTMLTAKERPDMIEYDWGGYTGGPAQAIADDVIISLNDYLEEHAPNYYDYMEGEKGAANNYLYKLQSVAEGGQYYGFNTLSIGNNRVFASLFVREDLLEKWGMDIPATIDDWTAFLAKAKSEGYEKPFTAISGVFNNTSGYESFNAAYDVSRGFYVEDGKILFAPFQDGFKDYIALLADWTKSGYFDTSFITNDEGKVIGNMTNEMSVATLWYISTMGEIEVAGRKNNPDFSLVACPLPMLEEGQSAKYADISAEATSVAIGISSTCHNYETAIEWCDYLYSEEGSILRTFGIEGDTYTIEEIDGENHYVYTDKIMDYEAQGLNSVNEALYKYLLPANHPGLNQHPDYLNGYYPEDCQKEALAIWNEDLTEAKKHRLPTLSYTDDELKEKTDIEEIAKDELEVALYDIILGQKDMSTYDSAIAKAKKDGYERVIEIHQAAYDRYISQFNS